MKKLYYRGTHPYSFRSGEWAEVVDIMISNRWCFVVQYTDGKIDTVPIVDTNNYELKEEAK